MQITRTSLAAITSLCLLLTACGGGGGGGSGDDGNNSSSSGSSSSSSSSSGGSPTASNVLPIQVTNGPNDNYVNGLFATVTVCQPGTSNCQSINNILVDTGSYGLRLMSSAMNLALPQQTINQSPLLECSQFMSGYTWGSIRIADIKMSGEQASAVPIQIIGDFSTIPTACSNTGKSLNSVASFGVNGVLGIGPQQADCPTCVNTVANATYYTCPFASSCTSVTVPAASQVQNPVYLFQTNNNGVIISMPAIPSSGALNTKGSLTFGIGTQSNNGLNNATVITTDNNGNFTTTYKGRNFTKSFLDSGSNGLFFNDMTLSICSSVWYCPATTQNLSATQTGQNSVSKAVSFSIANSNTLFDTSNNAFNNLGGMGSTNTFDWGLPFYYGRTIYTAYSGKNTPAGTGPYIAY